MQGRAQAGAELEARLGTVREPRGVDAADRGGEQQLVGGGHTVERQPLLARGMQREHPRPDRAGQLPPVERRGDQVRALDDEQVGVRGLENVAVEVHNVGTSAVQVRAVGFVMKDGRDLLIVSWPSGRRLEPSNPCPDELT